MNVSASPAFAQQVGAYLAHWRALGRRYRQEQWLLQTLLRELPLLGHDDLTADGFRCWFEGRKNLHANSRRKWAQLLHHFCVWRRRVDPNCFVPGTELICRAQPYVTPVIIGDRHVASMLAAADALEPSPNSPLRPATMRLAVVLLYTTGMRLGELQRLALGDIEDDGGVLRVRESKFHKSRLLPLSSSTRCELLAYLNRRTGVGFAAQPMAPLLCTRASGRMKPYSISGLQHGLNSLLRGTGMSAEGAQRPRVHDLRHNSGSWIIPSAASGVLGMCCCCWTQV
jgi:integrase/recombinase XerD